MPITYNRTVWKNHIVRRPRTYTEIVNSDQSRTDTPAPGEVYQQGTPLNEANLNNIEEGLQAVTEFANGLEEVKLEETIYTVTIPISGWSGNAPPYSRNVTVNGIRATDTPIIDIVQSGQYATDTQICDSWALISRITTRANGLTITADAIPSVAIPIQVRCLRHG